MRKVLGAWPLFKWLTGSQPSAPLVQQLLDQAEAGSVQLFLSMINAGEVYYSLARRQTRAEADEFLDHVLPGMPIQVVIPDRPLIIEAAKWKAQERISYADGFALATAVRLSARLVTGDPEMKNLDGRLIEWIGS